MNKELRGIIESDLLERYVLGEVTEQEQAKVLELRRSSPEIREALDELEVTMERMAFEENILPPPSLRDKVLQQDYNVESQMTPSRLRFSWMGYAASLLLIGVGIWFWQQQRINDLEAQVITYSERIAKMEEDCQKTNRLFALVNAPDTRPAVLNGTDYAPSSSVIVYWNPNKKVCLLHVMDLPDIPADKTYQLWADIDGEMKSLGTFDHQSAREELLQMAYLDDAESLNVTVEPLGGNDHATVSTLSAAVRI